MKEQLILAMLQLGLKLGPQVSEWHANRKSEDELVEDFRRLIKETDFTAWAESLKAEGHQILNG